MKSYKLKSVYGGVLLLMALLPFSVFSAVLDWDTNNWPLPSLAQTYNVAGSNININIAGDTAQLNTTGNPASPQTNQHLTGGTTNEDALFIRTDFINTSQNVVFTIDFTHPGGVSDLSFTFWDVDATSPQWIDQVQATATAGGLTVNPSSISDGVTNNPGVNTSTGFPISSNAGNSSPNGNVTFSFNQTNITQVVITYRNTTTGTPGNQWISLHDLTFDVAPTITKAFSPDAITVGDVSTLTINLGNNDTNTATLTSNLTDNLPTGLTVANPANIGGSCPGTVNAPVGSGTVTYTNGSTIPAGGCTITVEVTSSTVGTVINSIAANTLQTNLGNNAVAASDSLTVNPVIADLSITKNDGNLTYTPGGAGSYTLIVTNNGPGPVTAASIQDNLPNGVTLSSQWSCSATAGSSCSAVNGGSIGASVVSLTADIINTGVVTITVPVQFSANMSDY